jgi:hypothetical protein
MIASNLTDLLAVLAIVAACAGCLLLAYRIEPHWVSRDRQRFLSVGQELDQWGLPFGRHKEVRVRIDEDSASLMLTRRSLVRPAPSQWLIDAKAPDPPKGRVVYLLKKMTSEPVVGQMALRLPANSKMIPKLDEFLAVTGAEAEQARQVERQRAEQRRRAARAASDPPETRRSEPPADPG